MTLLTSNNSGMNQSAPTLTHWFGVDLGVDEHGRLEPTRQGAVKVSRDDTGTDAVDNDAGGWDNRGQMLNESIDYELAVLIAMYAPVLCFVIEVIHDTLVGGD